MKTNKFYTVLTILLVIMFAIAMNTSANNIALNDNPPEMELDNIKSMTHCCGKSFNFAEELYIQDIPFDTKKISAESAFKNAIKVEYEFADEAYIEDIPFDTYSITQVYFQSHYALSE